MFMWHKFLYRAAAESSSVNNLRSNKASETSTMMLSEELSCRLPGLRTFLYSTFGPSDLLKLHFSAFKYVISTKNQLFVQTRNLKVIIKSAYYHLKNINEGFSV